MKLVAFDYLDVVDSCNKNCFSFSFVLWTGVSKVQFRVLLYCVSQHSKTPFFQKTTRGILVKFVFIDDLNIIDSCNKNHLFLLYVVLCARTVFRI